MKFSFKCLLVVVIACILESVLTAPRAGAQISALPGYYNYYSSAVPFQNYGTSYPFMSTLYGNPYYSNPYYSSTYYGNPSAGWGMMNPYASPLTGLSGWGTGNYGNSMMSPFSWQSEMQPLLEALAAYNYLQYSIKFYETARDVPMLYLQDIQADQLGALMYSYAKYLEVSPEEAALCFIQQNYFQE